MKTINVIKEIECPYCGRKQKHSINPSLPRNIEIVLCEPEEGGCDNYFAVGSKVEVDIKVFELKEN